MFICPNKLQSNTLHIICFVFISYSETLKHTENIRLPFLPDLKFTGPCWLVLPVTVGESIGNEPFSNQIKGSSPSVCTNDAGGTWSLVASILHYLLTDSGQDMEDDNSLPTFSNYNIYEYVEYTRTLLAIKDLPHKYNQVITFKSN